MNLVLNLVWLIPLFPLLAAAIITFVQPVYRRKKVAARLTIAMMAVSLVLSTLVLVATLADPVTLGRLGGAAGHGEAAAGEREATAPSTEEPATAGHEVEIFAVPGPVGDSDQSFHWMAVGDTEPAPGLLGRPAGGGHALYGDPGRPVHLYLRPGLHGRRGL